MCSNYYDDDLKCEMCGKIESQVPPGSYSPRARAYEVRTGVAPRVRNSIRPYYGG